MRDAERVPLLSNNHPGDDANRNVKNENHDEVQQNHPCHVHDDVERGSEEDEIREHNQMCINFSLIVLFCCNPVFGLIGCLFGCSARKYLNNDSDYGRARCMSQIGFTISVIGILVTILAIVFYSFYLVYFIEKVQ